MFNREKYGLHHPGNIVPCCNDCNKRKTDKNGKHVSCERHLSIICKESGKEGEFEPRRDRILKHHTEGNFAYPKLTNNAEHAIRVIAESLYNGIKMEIEKSSGLYVKLTDAFVIKETNKSS